MSILARVKEKITEYIDVYVKLFKINFIGRTASLLSYVLFALICMFILFCIMLLFGFGLVETLIAFGLPKVAAFFITLGVYILLLVIVVMLRTKITRFFASGIIKVMTEGDEDEKG